MSKANDSEFYLISVTEEFGPSHLATPNSRWQLEQLALSGYHLFAYIIC